MADFEFGDLICYRPLPGLTAHDAPIMYVGPCGHPRRHGGGEGLIDIFAPDAPDEVDHKDPAMWQRCTHLVDEDGSLLMTFRPPNRVTVSKPGLGSVEVYIGGTKVDALSVEFGEMKFDV